MVRGDTIFHEGKSMKKIESGSAKVIGAVIGIMALIGLGLGVAAKRKKRGMAAS